MLRFTQLPPDSSPLGGEIRYTVESDAPRTIDIRIRTPQGELLGAKRFVGVTTASFDAAPYLRGAVRFAPEAGGTGLRAAADRRIEALVEASEVPDDAVDAVDAVRSAAAYTPVSAGTEQVPGGASAVVSEVSGDVWNVAGGAGPVVAESALAPGASDGAVRAESVSSGGAASDRAGCAAPPVRGSGEAFGPVPGAVAAQETGGAGGVTASEAVQRDFSDSVPATMPEPASESVPGVAPAIATPVLAASEAVPGVASGAASKAEPDSLPAVAPVRGFLPCAGAVGACGLLTTMPRERLVAPGECDELSFVHEGPLTVTVTATAADGTSAESHRTAGGGMHLFRLATADFPGAERITVDAGPCGAVSYTVLPAAEGSVRLAWRTEAGGVEHYTFPVVCEVRVAAGRRRVRRADGLVSVAATVERRRCVESAWECDAVAGALGGLLFAPQVWCVCGAEYQPVDVVEEEAVVHRHGLLVKSAFTIRPTRKTPLPWNC